MARSKKIKIRCIRKFVMVDRDTEGEITGKRVIYPDQELSVPRSLAGQLIGSNKAEQSGVTPNTNPDDILPRAPSAKVFSAAAPDTGKAGKKADKKADK